MRHQYTPVFREFTTSSMWAKSPAIRCVWLWLLLHADPEGYVPGTIPGIAVAANVTEAEAREAFALFEAPDPDSSSKEMEGRRAVKVDRGWHLVNFVAHRERAKEEAEKARKRRWAQKHYEETRQLPLPGFDSGGSSESLGAPKPKPKSSSPKKEKISAAAPEPRVIPVVVMRIPDEFELRAELEAEAKAIGVERPKEHFERLKTGPIGGSRGVLLDKLDAYIRSQFPKWRTWEETDRAKAQRAAETGPSSRFGGQGATDSATPPPKRIPGLPGWVGEAHVKAARERGVSIKAAIKGFAQSYHLPVAGLPPCDVHRPFLDYIESLAEGRAA